jgi:hypothetical protein
MEFFDSSTATRIFFAICLLLSSDRHQAETPMPLPDGVFTRDISKMSSVDENP